MKKIILFSIAALFFGAFAAPKAEAQNYASRVISVCPVCHQNVYAIYRPVNYGGVIRYTWVPVYHTQCVANRYVPQYPQGTSYRYVVPGHGHQHRHYHYHRSPRYSGYVTPGFTIRIRR